MKTRLGFALALSSLVAVTHVAAAQVQVRIVPQGQQQIESWGVSPAPLDWVGRLELQGEMRQHVQKIYRDSGATAVRLSIGGMSMYNSAARHLQTNAALWALSDQLALFEDTGIRQYILCILSPPVALKKYYAVEPYILGDPNPLREEFEPLFAQYVTDVLRELRAGKRPLPVAVGVQVQPDNPPTDWGIPVTSAHGAVYSPRQWARVLKQIRTALDQAGFKNVGLIGPETYGLEGWSQWNASSGADAITTAMVEPQLAGWAYYGDGKTEPWRLSLDPLRPMLDRMKARNAVWMLSANCHAAANDSEALVDTFAQMERDLIDMGVSHWFWRYGFDWRPSSEVMMYGRRGAWTPVGLALTSVWKSAPPGSRVHPLSFSSESSSEVEALRGFALKNSRRIVCVCVNTGAVPLRLVFGEPMAGASVTVLTGAQSSNIDLLRRDKDCTMVLPGKSVALMIAKSRGALFSLALGGN